PVVPSSATTNMLTSTSAAETLENVQRVGNLEADADNGKEKHLEHVVLPNKNPGDIAIPSCVSGYLMTNASSCFPQAHLYLLSWFPGLTTGSHMLEFLVE
ncbi:hypothetical protein AAF712_016701, partial [Marasmius tenuissimus]